MTTITNIEESNQLLTTTIAKVEKQHELSTAVADEDPMAYVSNHDSDEFKRSFASNYLLRKKPKVFFAMALGFPEFRGILGRPPISTIKRKELNDQYIPKAEDYKQEIKRRAHYFMNDEDESRFYNDELKRPHPLKTKRSSIVLPQPNQWLNTQLKHWLVDRPMKPNNNDTKFIRYQIKRSLDFLISEGVGDSQDALQEFPIIPTPIDTPLDGPAAITTEGTYVAEVVHKPIVPITKTMMVIPTSSCITPSLEEISTLPFVYSIDQDSDEFKLSAAGTFLLKGGQPRILFTLAQGIPELQSLVESSTYNLVKRKEVTEDFMPRAEDYRYEIKRRAHFFMNMEEQTNYYTDELKVKNPLENLRGLVTSPQPAQWKVHALKEWLSERPLKPDQRDLEFLQDAIKTCTNALTEAVVKDPTLTTNVGSKRSASMMMMPSMGGVVGDFSQQSVMNSAAMLSGATSLSGDNSLMQVLAKQDAILGAVNKQNQQQSIINKIIILTQSTMGYQQELSLLRSTHNDIENRILSVELKIAETTTAADVLHKIITKQEERMAGVNAEIKKLVGEIASIRAEIELYNQELKYINEDRSTKEKEILSSEPPIERLKAEDTRELVVDANDQYQDVLTTTV